MSMSEQKPTRTKREFDEAFRRNAVALLENSGRSLKEIAAELGISYLESAGLDQAARAQQAQASRHAGGGGARDGASAS